MGKAGMRNIISIVHATSAVTINEIQTAMMMMNMIESEEKTTARRSRHSEDGKVSLLSEIRDLAVDSSRTSLVRAN